MAADGMRRVSFYQPQGELTAELVVNVLLLVGANVLLWDASEWTEVERLMAYDWAMREYLRASDNAWVRRRPKPSFVP